MDKRLTTQGGISPELMEEAKAAMLAIEMDFAEAEPPSARSGAGYPSMGGFIETHFDFTTCQRSDGSYYGSSGRCLKGSEAKGGVPEKEKSAKKSSGGGASGDGGAARKAAKASGEVADRKAAARKENEAKKEANARTDSKMSSKRAAEVKAAFDAKRKAAAGGQDGPKPTASQSKAAVNNLRKQQREIEHKQDNGTATKADEAKLKRVKASLREYEISGKQKMQSRMRKQEKG